MLSTPITAGSGRSSSVRSASGPAEPAGGTEGESEAFMRPALRGRAGGVKTGWAVSVSAGGVDIVAPSRITPAVVPANAGTHNPREKFGEDS
ncbi:hypothetical protein ACVME5_004988 [Bradyrhizobium liaoningense]|nr:hypothetical protein GCM10007858_70590 [Bradyrhizobium liaoningense]